MKSPKFLYICWRVLSCLLIGVLLYPVGAVGAAEPEPPLQLEAGEVLPIDAAPRADCVRVTLITGDVINVVSIDGVESISVSPADPAKLGQHFTTIESNDFTYVFPSSVDLAKVDRELFNIDYLISEQYHEMDSLPLIVEYRESLSDTGVRALENSISVMGMEEPQVISNISMMATRLDYAEAPAAYAGMVREKAVEKIWLDRKFYPTLDTSVENTGANDWESWGYDGAGIKIAILDTGIDDTHPALDDMNDDGDVVSDPKVVDLVDFTDDGDGFDYVGHGTHCAGISAGTAAGTAYEGMAPGAWLWNVKVLDHTGSGWESWIIDGIQYASLGPDGTTGTGDEADIISMSLGSQTASVGDDPEGRAVKAAVEAGVVVVISAGNSGNDGVDDAYTIGRPGLTEEVITVGALNEAFNGVVDFSSRGPTLDERIKPDILAPGEAIMSSVPYGEHYDITYGDKVADGYAPLDGTSMACPHVAGAAALLLQQAAGSFPGTLPAPQFVKNALLCSAEDLGLGVFHQGVGRLDMTACWGADGAPDVMLAPANQYLGDYDISAPTAAGSLTFYAGDTARNLTLTGTLVKAATGEATASSINFTGGNTVSVPANGSATKDFTVALGALDYENYAGIVTAAIDGTGITIRAVFNFYRSPTMTVHKTDIDNNDAVSHQVWVIKDNDPGITELTAATDINGNAVIHMGSITGNVHVVSLGWDDDWDTPIWTVKENVPFSAGMTVYLDEQDTNLVTFDPGRAEQQVPAAKTVRLFYNAGANRFYYNCYTMDWYPQGFSARVSNLTTWDFFVDYQYYPQADFNSSNPSVIDTALWHNIAYQYDSGVSGPIINTPDYTNSSLVHRQTAYHTAVYPELNRTTQYVYYLAGSNNRGSAFTYYLNAPQQREEWFSPNTHYWDIYEDGGRQWLVRDVYTLYAASGADLSLDLGGQPLMSGMFISTDGDEFVIDTNPYSTFIQDHSGNNVYNNKNDYPAHLLITLPDYGGYVFYDEYLDNDFLGYKFEHSSYQGVKFIVRVDTISGLSLSQNVTMDWTFTVGSSPDAEPPGVSATIPGIDLYGTVPSGNVDITVSATDYTTPDLSLYYRFNETGNWLSLGTVANVYETTFTVPSIPDNTYVDLRISATDDEGNTTTQTIPRAFYVFDVTYPDLALTDLHEEWVTDGETYRVSCTMTNTGNATAPSGHLLRIASENNFETHDVPVSLAPGESYTYLTAMVVNYTGELDTITASVDAYASITEASETNNYEILFLAWPAKPYLSVTDLWEEWSGDDYVIHFTQKNIGNGPADAGHDASLTVDGSVIGYHEVTAALGSLESYSGVFAAGATVTGAYDTVTVMSDVNGEIDEIINPEVHDVLYGGTQTRTIAQPPMPDLKVLLIDIIPINDSYQIIGLVQNIGNAVAPGGHDCSISVNGTPVGIVQSTLTGDLEPGEYGLYLSGTIPVILGSGILLDAGVSGPLPADTSPEMVVNYLLQGSGNSGLSEILAVYTDSIAVACDIYNEVTESREDNNITTTGYDVAPDIDVAPLLLDFGSTPIGNDADAQSITISNFGNAYLHVGQLEMSDSQFDITLGDSSNQSLVPGNFATVYLAFTPDEAGLQTGTLTIPSDDPDEPEVIVELRGTGLDTNVTAVRDLPDTVYPGQTFTVEVAFTAPMDDFKQVTLNEHVPSGWGFALLTASCSPVPAGDLMGDGIEYYWADTYDAGAAFTAVYNVTVPGYAAFGPYDFSGEMTYWIDSDFYGVDVTGDTQIEVVSPPPSVITVSPADSETGVAVETDIQVTFDHVMDTTSVQNALSFSPDTVSGTFGWNGANTTLTFTPAPSLAYSTVYTVIVDTTAMNVSGTHLAADKVWSFTTVDRVPPAIVTLGATNITTSGATVSANLTALGDYDTVDVVFDYGTESGNYTGTTGSTTRDTVGVVEAVISGLDSDETYYYRARTLGSEVTSDEASFTTLKETPTVTTEEASDIDTASAKLNLGYTPGDYSPVEVRFVYKESVETDWTDDTEWVTKTEAGTYSFDLAGLDSNTGYTFQAQLLYDTSIIISGDEETFTTSKIIPEVTTKAATDVKATTATINMDYDFHDYGSGDLQFAYRMYGAADWTYTGWSDFVNAGSWGRILNGLATDTQYEFKAMLRYDTDKEIEGDTLSFLTGFTPLVTTGNATNITTSTATLHGSLDRLGDDYDTVDVYFEWGTESGVYTDNVTAGTLDEVTDFSADITGLVSDTPYFYRARTIEGDVRGEEKTFTTAKQAPVVETLGSAMVMWTTAEVTAKMDDLGDYPSVDLSVIYGTSPDDLSFETEAVERSDTFLGVEFGLLDLEEGTPYYFRAKATTGDVTVYGERLAFTTLADQPSVITGTVDVTGFNSATFNMEFDFTTWGPDDVLFVYCPVIGVIPQTTAFDVRSGSGTYSFDVSGLESDTDYWVMACIRAAGYELYGEKVYFTTEKQLPSVTTLPASNVTTSGATLHGDLASLGDYDTVDVVFEYGEASGTYTDNTTAVTANQTGVVSVNLTGLKSNTPYYYRVRTVEGNVTGDETTFTTLKVVPVVTVRQASDVTAENATLTMDIAWGDYPAGTAWFDVWNTADNIHSPAGTSALTSANISYAVIVAGLTEGAVYGFQACLDYTDDTATSGTGYFKAGNHTPTAPVIAITPPLPNASQNLVCAITTPSTDSDTADVITYTFAWYRNDQLQDALTFVTTNSSRTSTVGSALTATGDIWKCIVTPNDGFVDGNSAQAQVTISAPPSPVTGGGGGIGGGGGGSGATDDKRFTNLSASSNGDGTLWEDVTAYSVDIKLELAIPEGTQVLNANGYPPYSITVATLAEPGDSPEKAVFIGAVYDITPNGLTFDPFAILNIYYDEGTFPEGIDEQNLLIYTWNATTQAWEALECTVDTENNCISVRITHLCRFSILAGTSPAVLSVGQLNLAPADVLPGESVTVSATVSNTGDLAGTYAAALSVNGETVQTRNIIVPGGKSAVVIFSLTAGEPGTHTVAIGNRQASFTVRDKPEEPAPSPTPTVTEPSPAPSPEPEPEDTPAVPQIEQTATPEPEPTGTAAALIVEEKDGFSWWIILLLVLGAIAAGFSIWKALRSKHRL